MHKDDNRPIGVFDSGLGGLTVVSALNRALPEEDILYLGDTARVPYGDKSVDSIRRFARKDAEFLFERGVKILVVACNTVSAVAMDELRKHNPGAHILGVLEAGIHAVLATNPAHVAVIGTRATIGSDAYRRGIHAKNPSIVVESIACPLLVPMAEEGITDSTITRSILDIYLHNVKRNPPDTLLLGCTHYPLFKAEISSYLDGRTAIVDSASACAEHVLEYLESHHLRATKEKEGKNSFYVTDLHSTLPQLAARFLGRIPERIEKIALPDDGF